MFKELRCPTETCYGWVSEIEEGSSEFYGCGSCGNVWPSLDELNNSIDGIISEHDYRRKAYIKDGNNWAGVELDDEPEDYEELVVKEFENE